MNFEMNKTSSNTKNNNKILIVMIGIVILAIIIVCMLLVLLKEEKKADAANGILVDGVKLKNLTVSNVFFEGDELYFPIKENNVLKEVVDINSDEFIIKNNEFKDKKIY